jgi:methionine aminotransferase
MSALASRTGAVNLGQGFPDFDCDPRLLARRGRRDARGPEPVPADGRRAGAARGGVAQDRALYGRRYDPTRDHRHRRRHAGHPHRRAVLRAPGRRGDRARALLRQLRTEHRTGRRHGGARAADAGQLPARLRRASPRRSRRAPARSSSTRRTTPAPRCGRAPRCSAGRTAGADRHPADQRRGLRAHGVRRRAACQRVVHPGAGRARLRVSSFGKTYHVTGWKVGTWRRRRADGRVPQGAPVQRLHRQHADAARPGALHGRPAPYLELPAFYQRKRDLFRAGLAARGCACCPAKAPTSRAWTTAPSAA